MSTEHHGSSDPYGQHPHDPAYGGSSPYGGDPAYGEQFGNSWGDPAGQQSAAYVDHAAYAQSQPSAAYAPANGGQDQGPWQPAATQPGPGPQAGPQAGGTPRDDSFFGALFDFGFTKYATPTLIKVGYIVGLVLGGLYWIGGALLMLTVGSLTSGYGSSSGGSGLAGVVWLILGAPVYFFYVLALRIQLEMMIAMVRTNQDTKAIRAKLES